MPALADEKHGGTDQEDIRPDGEAQRVFVHRQI